MDIDDAIMETDSSDTTINAKTKVIVMADSSTAVSDGDTRETKDELNPSPPNEAVNTSPTNPEKSTKPSDSDDDSDITIVRESVPNPGGMMMHGSSPSNLYQSVPHSVSSSVIFPHTRQQQSPNKLLQMQPFSVNNSGQMPPGVSTIMQLPVIRPQPGRQFHMVPHATSPAGVQQLSTTNSGGNSTGVSMMFQSIIQGGHDGNNVVQPGLGSVMTIGSPVQLIQPNISITPKPAGAPSNSSPKPIPMPAVTINPVDASTLQKKNILIKNPPNMTFKSLPSPENVKPFTGKIVRLSSPVITANPASIAALHKATHPDVEITSVSRKLELNDEEDALSLQCNEQFDDSFEKKSAADANKDDMDEIQFIGERFKETKPNVDLLKPLETEEDRESKEIKLKTNEFGMVELEDLGLGLKKKELSIIPKVHASPRKDSMTRKIQDDEILYCEGCGCYGMAGEFVAQNSCSNTCNNIISARIKDRHRKEKELQILKKKRMEKKAAQLKPVKKKGNYEEDIKPVPVHTWTDQKKGFLWSKYLEYCGARSAPVRLFARDPFPEPHGFKEGMKLEAIDPQHQSLFCVVTVAEVLGARLRLHFDGYGDSHDFWENSDSENLFPAGWCSKNNQKLSPPKGYSRRYFNWATYLSQTDSVAAPDNIFKVTEQAKEAEHAGSATAADSSALQGWKVGMKLEACDRQNKSLVCVATVANIVQGRVLLHFDGWEMDYDYWTLPTSQNVKPVGWCSKNKKQLNPPKGNHPSAFSWSEYLQVNKAKSVPAWAFRSPGSYQNDTDFQEGMRLEAVDVYNPRILRVASVVSTEGRQLELHYDGWPDELNHWVEDENPNIHPCGWAAKTGHPLSPPLTAQEVSNWTDRGGCSIPGCRGIGHVKGAKYLSHHSISACPYAPQNLESNNHISDRLQGIDLEGDEGSLYNNIAEEGGEGDVEGDNEALGRGNRRRKKRKFFDEDGGGEEQGGGARKKRGSLEDEDESQIKEKSQTDSKPEIPAKITRRKSNSTEIKNDPDIKEEPLDFSKDSKPPAVGGIKVPKEDVGIQTRSPTPPTFATEWEEGVRSTVWNPGYLPQPFPTGSLPYCWREHSLILLGSKQYTQDLTFTKAKHWSIDEVIDFLGGIPNLDTGTLEPAIRDQEIDGEALLLLTQNDITEILGVKLGPAIKIYNAIMTIRIRRE